MLCVPDDGLAEIAGDVLTVPLAATFIVVPPVEASVTFPERAPLAEVVVRTYIVVEATLPLVCVNVKALV